MAEAAGVGLLPDVLLRAAMGHEPDMEPAYGHELPAVCVLSSCSFTVCDGDGDGDGSGAGDSGRIGAACCMAASF